MESYIAIVSLVYIIVIFIKLKDNQKSFEEYIVEYKKIKLQLYLIGEDKNPFLTIKLVNLIFYTVLILYYISNLVFFASNILIQIITFLLLAIASYKFIRKMLITSIEDFEELIEVSQKKYKRKKLFNVIYGLLEFAYAFNALSLLSLYY